MAGSQDGSVVINYPNANNNVGNDDMVSIMPVPLLPMPTKTSSNITYVKEAPKDTIVFDESSLSAEILLELFFEDIGGIELASLSRADAIDGQDVVYSPIKNLSSIRRRFNPNNIISSAASLDTYFSRFAIDLLRRGVYFPYVDGNGSIVVEIDNVLTDEEIEVQILSNGTIERVEQ